MKIIAATALVAAFAGGTQAQAPAPSPAASPTPAAAPTPAPPKPAPELQKLAFLVGDWIHDETVHPGPMGPGGPGKGRSKTQWILGDHHLYVNYVSRNAAMGTLEARGLIGWDPDGKAYRMDWYDNMGAAIHYRGDFTPEGTLVFNAELMLQGKPVKEQLSIQRQEGKLVFTSSLPGPDGALKPAFESVATPEKK
jgi:hypothetical protein